MSAWGVALAWLATMLVAALLASLLYGFADGRTHMTARAMRILGSSVVALTVAAFIGCVASVLVGIWRWAL